MARGSDFTVNIKALFDASDVKAKVNQIQNSFNNLKLSDGLKRNLEGNFNELNKALSEFQAKAQKGVQTKADAKGITSSMDTIVKEFTKLQGIIDKVKSEIGNTTDLSQIIKLDQKTTNELKTLQEEAARLKKEINDINTSKLSAIQNALSQIKSQKASEHGAAAIKLFNEGDAEGALNLLDKVIAKQQQLERSPANKTGTITQNIENLTKIRTEIVNAINEAQTQTQQLGQNAQNQARVVTEYYNSIVSGVNNAAGAIDNYGRSASQASPKVRGLADDQARVNTEIDQLKSRIQYFFGLNNAIQLVRRTLRSAFNTIKDLDKAMTATAVVTDFSVGDMWAQLPEYTRRANELGVTTKEAYEAATLYYQQGLKTNEVMAISNETLKMARIAGLEASDATDRMTNALRGFNMEINETNAQRIDDVYSRLAAISASNVDEISTAMTKVASLAHSANMEFETTAAFLAQIIETTRESAETAGTALKTVVARFSEVKELYSEGDLRGQDEEGEVIDVNKISKALRTAGIDLNKYFLGEVGLDDIFMELASKWDSLTSVQQRYIATQAAGSRQQSRFIALMSDYARTQELVGEAYTANGAAATQFAKTQESLQSKLARLKNAWDQFAMGILNSDIVKIGVDLLTNLLNGINALTSGFGLLNEGIGGVINTLLKLGLVIGGLNLGRGLFTGAIGSLAGQGTFSQIASTAMFGAQGATGILSGLAGKGGLGMAAAGFLNPLAAVGGKLWGGLQTIGLRGILSSGQSGLGGKLGSLSAGMTRGLVQNLGFSAETAMGLTGLVPILGGILTTVIAIKGAYAAWLKFTPEGQLKTATKLAEKNQELAQETQKISDGYKQVQEEYQKYSDAVNQSINKAERDTSIKERNEYLLSLIKQDQTYAQYLQSAVSEGGEIILTLNEDALAAAAKDAAEAASDAAVKSYFTNATQAGAQAAVYTVQGERISQQQPDYMRSWYDVDYNSMQEEEKENAAQVANLLVQAELARRQEANYARLGYTEILKDSVANKTISNEIADNLSAALGNIFKDTGDIGTDNLNEIVKLVASSSEMQSIVSIMAGNIDTNLLDVEEGDFFEALKIEEDDINQFESVLGKDGVKTVKDFINQLARGTKELQEQNRQRLIDRLGQNNVSDLVDIAQNLTPDIQSAMLEALDAAEDLITDGQYESLIRQLFNSETTKDDIEEIQTLLSQINLDDPLAAFTKLETKFKNGSENAQDLYKLIKDSNPEIFNTATLIKDNLSVAYGEVSDKVLELLKDNKKLTPENIEELAKESKVLKQLLDAGVVSTKSLATAFTMAGKEGTDWLDNIDESVLKVLDNMYIFNDLVNDVHNTIANFDEGIDYGEGIDFLSDKIKELSELVANYEFGNERTAKLWELIFGGDYKEAWANGEDQMRTRIQEFMSWIENDAYGAFTSEKASELGIVKIAEGDLKWDLSGYKDLNTVIDDVASKLKISTDAAKMFIEAFKSHGDLDFSNTIDQLSLNSAVNYIVDKSNKRFWSKDELQTIADSFGVQLKDLEDLIQDKVNTLKSQGEQDVTVIGDVFTGKLGFEKFKEDLKISGQNFETWFNQFVDQTENGYKVRWAELQNALSQMGYDEFAQTDLIHQFGANIEGLETDKIELDNLVFDISAQSGVTVQPELLQTIKDTIQEEYDGASTEQKELILNTINAVLGSDASLEDKDDILTWIGEQLSDGKINLNNLLAIPSFKALTDPQKAMVMLALAQNCKGETVNFVGLTANLSKAGLEIKDIATILDTILPQQFSEKSITFSSLAAIINDLSLDETTKTKAELLGDLASLFITYNTTNAEDLGTLRIALQELGLTESEIDNLLSNLGIRIENRSKTNPPKIDLWPKINVHMDDETDLQAAMANVTANLTQEGKIPAYLPGKAITWLPDDQEIARIFDEAVQNNKIYGVGGAYQLIGQYLKAQFTTQDFKADPKLQGMLEQWAAAYFRAGIATLPEITSASQNGQEIEISADAQDYEETLQNVISTAATSAEDQAAETAVIIEGDLNGISVEDLQANMQAAIDSAFGVGFANAQVMANGTHFTATLTFIPNMLPFTISLSSASAAGRHGGGGPGSSITESYSSRAAGGRLPAVSKALTGEEGPEIVWNKEQGYSYITGANGPEFRSLNSGDEVFNAQETRKILQNSKSNKIFHSYDRGRWNIGNNTGDGDSEEGIKSTWRNELDWLYNLLEDIAELERRQSEYAEQHDQLLNSINTTGEELFKLTEQQLDNLKEQLENQRVRQQKRKDELEWWAGYADAAGLGKYVWWNDKDQTIEIDWDQIEAITDQDTYDEVKEIIDHLEQAQDEMDDATSAILDIQGQIQDLENRYMQEFTDFQQRIYDALVNQYQVQIDQLSELNDTLNDTNASILDSLQREIDLQRQIRDNTDTENNIRDMEARLAYLRRDTTGSNENEIRQLERELEEAWENYSDTLIDQSLDRLQQANNDAAEQRQQQIELLTEQLNYWKESGELWGEVARLMREGIDSRGTLIEGSELEQILRNAEGWKAMSEVQREVWGNELIAAANQAGAYLLKLATGFSDLANAVWSTLPEDYRPASDKPVEEKKSYATGGLATKSGPAWLDGSVNEPEYVLNAKQTDAFLRLADILPTMLSGGISNTSLGGNVYVELNMNVGEISDDYGVDRLVERVKSDIYAASNYRNVNAVNFVR